MTNDEIEIDLLKILKTWLKKAWIIVLVAAVLGGGLFAYGKATHVPVYTATTTLYARSVKSVDGNASQNSLSEARSMVDSCIVVLKTRKTLDAVIEEAGAELTSGQLSGMVSSAAVNKTEIFTVSVTSADPQMAADLANAVGKVLPGHVAVVNPDSNVGVIDEALVPAAPNGNDIMKNAALAAVLGAFAVCGVIAVQCVVDDIKKAKKNK